MDMSAPTANAENIKEQNRKLLNSTNAIPGFDPTTLLSRFGDDARGYYNYLKAAPRLAWFRLAHPEGRTAMINHSVSANHSFVEAQVFFNKDDAYCTANGFAWMDRDDTLAGQNHLKSAQTNALCIALGNAGFGTPVHARFDPSINIYSQTEDIGEVPLDMGTPEPSGTPKDTPTPKAKATRKPRGKGNLDDLKPEESVQAEASVSATDEAAAAQAATEQPAPEQSSAPPASEDAVAGEAAPADDTPPDDIPAGPAPLQTLDDAMAVVIRTGNYKGKSFEQISKEVTNFKRVIDFYANPIGDTVPEDIKAAAEFIRIHKFGGE